MEVCRRPTRFQGAVAVSQPQPLPPSLMPNYVHSTNGSVTLTFNNQITNQVCFGTKYLSIYYVQKQKIKIKSIRTY